MSYVTATRRGIRLYVPGSVGRVTVDVLFDGHRIWSTKLPKRSSSVVGRMRGRWLEWPHALRPYVRGTTELTVRRSADESVLVQREVDFGGDGRAAVTDAQGHWVAMNKWDRLGPVLEGQSDGARDRLLANGRKLADLMESWGYPIYMVGGTLLGAVRSGAMLPHDDDIDFAFLCDAHSDLEVGRVSYELVRSLREAGYTALVLSLAQVQVTFFTDDGHIDHYIDIFTGYHTEDGLYNQPFALRGTLPPEALVPTTTMTVDGVDLPAPADPEAWLEFAYGKNWRVPDPSFQFVLEPATQRRFENYFGVHNRQRMFWEKHYQRFRTRPKRATGGEPRVDEFLELLPADAYVVDLGCGDGRLTERIAAAGHQVLGLDYSFEGLRLAERTRPDNVEYRFCNLNDGHMLLTLALELVSQGRQPYFFAHQLLGQMQDLGRMELLRFLNIVLDGQTFCFATFSTERMKRIPQNPNSWELALPRLLRQTRRVGLSLHPLGWNTQPTSVGERRTLTTLIWR